MRRTERAAYRTKFYSNLSSPTHFDEEPKNPSDKYSYHWDFNTKIAVYYTLIATDAL
jgi:hypothetical protein